MTHVMVVRNSAEALSDSRFYVIHVRFHAISAPSLASTGFSAAEGLLMVNG